MAHPLVFVDIETTGMSPRSGGRVLEIGAIRVENGEVTGTMNTLINPGVEVPYFITQITGIDDSHIGNSPAFEQVIPMLNEISEGAIFVAHNVNFDYKFIQSEYWKASETLFSRPRLCTVRLSRALYPLERGHSLSKLIERHGYQVANRHRAYDDAEVLWRFYREHQQRDAAHLGHLMDKLLVL